MAKVKVPEMLWLQFACASLVSSVMLAVKLKVVPMVGDPELDETFTIGAIASESVMIVEFDLLLLDVSLTEMVKFMTNPPGNPANEAIALT